MACQQGSVGSDNAQEKRVELQIVHSIFPQIIRLCNEAGNISLVSGCDQANLKDIRV